MAHYLALDAAALSDLPPAKAVEAYRDNVRQALAAGDVEWAHCVERDAYQFALKAIALGRADNTAVLAASALAIREEFGRGR